MSDLENKIVKGSFGGGGGQQAAPVSSPAWEDPEGLIYNSKTYSDYQFAQVKDLLSEGPIEGLVTGEYTYSGQVGNLGYSEVKFKLNRSVATTEDPVKFLKSIYWNANPLIDSQEKFNFQQIDVSYTKGGPYGTDDQSTNIGATSYLRVINERLRGPNELATTNDELTNFKKTYKITNRECNKIDINLRISSLYQTLKYQDLGNFDAHKGDYPGVESIKGQTFNLKAEGRDPSATTAFTSAGIGSVIEYKTEVRIQWRPIFKEGRSLTVGDSILSPSITYLDEINDVVYTANNSNGAVAVILEGKISQGYEKQITIDFADVFAGLNTNDNWLGWEITLLKMSPESTTSSRVAYVSIDSIVERYYSSYRFPNSAIVTSKFNAEYFSKIPDRSYDVKLLKVKVPSNYDPITKTYGNITGLPISLVKESAKGFNDGFSEIYYYAFGTGYFNTDNTFPPITDGLIAQFDATGAVTGVGSTTLTSWNNTIAGSPYKAVLGNGTYTSPNGAASKPTKSAISANGKTGVAFTNSQTIQFKDAESASTIGTNGSLSIFAVCKWEQAGTPTDYSFQRKILKTIGTYPTYWTLGFDNQYARSFSFSSAIAGGDGTNYSAYNFTDLYSSKPERNTHIVGSVIRPKGQKIEMFWDDNYLAALNDNSTYSAYPPVGLAINDDSTKSSYCSLFELLIYNRDLTSSESNQIVGWLDKKWNTSVISGVYDQTNVLYSKSGALNIKDANIKIPIRTVAGDGDNTPAIGQTFPVRDLIPERYIKGITSDWYLSNQGHCSFYSDLFLKLNPNSAAGAYGLMHREGQFSLAITGDPTTDLAGFTLKVFGARTNTYTINKQIKIPFSQLTSDYHKITAYIAPVVTRVGLNYDAKILKHKSNYETILQGDGNTLIYHPSDIANIPYNLADGGSQITLGTTTFIPTIDQSTNGSTTNRENLIKSITLTEEIAPINAISNITGSCAKMVDYSYVGPVSATSNNWLVPVTIYDYFPDILNAKLVILVDNKEEIIIKLNINDYDKYSNFVLNAPSKYAFEEKYHRQTLSTSNTSFVNFYVDRTSGNAFTNQYTNFNPPVIHNDTARSAIKNFNTDSKNTDVYLEYDAPISANLNPSQKTVTIGLNSNDIYFRKDVNPIGTGFTPFTYINNTGNLELFVSKPAFGFSKISGYADGLKIDKLNFDRTSLMNANNKSLFSNQDGSTNLIYTPIGITGASVSNDLWDGTFKDGKEWTDNPAWCFYDLLTNKRYGAGNYVPESNVDKWSLYQIAKYCDEMVSDGYGGVEPRFTFNTYITSQDDALKVLNDIASVFRGMFYYANGYIYAVNDMPQNNPVYTFTNANVVNGNFNYESTSVKDRNSACYVRYIDKTNLYKPAVEYVENVQAVRRYGLKETEVTAFGCTSRGQAQRLGRWILASEFLETDTVTFDTGPEASYLRPGDTIKVYDYNKKYSTVGGRLQTISLPISGGNINTTNPNAFTGRFALDRKIDFGIQPNQTYKFSILSPSYNLDPSMSGAVTGSSDFGNFRKPFSITYLINSGQNIITGTDYDSIYISGNLTGINYTGLANFTGGASGYSPKSIIWTLENNNQLDATSANDFDYYRVFKVQEASDAHSYTVFGTQMVHLKYTQIESGLNLLPNTKRIDPATAPDYATFCIANTNDKTYDIDVNITYNQAIYENTIGFKIFVQARQSYTNSFDANKFPDFTYKSIDISNSSIQTNLSGATIEAKIKDLKLEQNTSNTEIRIYGVNALNLASSSYVVAAYYQDADCIAFDNFTNIFDPNTPIDKLARTNFDILPYVNFGTKDFKTKLVVPLHYDFIKKEAGSRIYRPENNNNYKYRLIFLPEYASTKSQFMGLYKKYLENDLARTYWFTQLSSSFDGSYDNIANEGQFRNFSVGIDVVAGETDAAASSSKNFTTDQFKLITYDDQDALLQRDCENIANDQHNLYTFKFNDQNIPEINIWIRKWADINAYNPYVRQYWLMLTPPDITDFSFDKYYFWQSANEVTLYRNPTTPGFQGTLIPDVRLLLIRNDSEISALSQQFTRDFYNRGFNLGVYKGWIIAEDLTMDANNPPANPIFEYTNKIINGSTLTVSAFGPQYAEKRDLIQMADKAGKDLYTVIHNAGINYLHYAFNYSSLFELRFIEPVPINRRINNGQQAGNPIIDIHFDNIIYKPAQSTNITDGQRDLTVFQNGNIQYNMFGNAIQFAVNREEDFGPNASASNRDFKYNGNKVFVGQLREATEDERIYSDEITRLFGNVVKQQFVKDDDVHYGETFKHDISIANINEHFSEPDFNIAGYYTNGDGDNYILFPTILKSNIINDNAYELIADNDEFFGQLLGGFASEKSSFGYCQDIKSLTYYSENAPNYIESAHTYIPRGVGFSWENHGKREGDNLTFGIIDPNSFTLESSSYANFSSIDSKLPQNVVNLYAINKPINTDKDGYSKHIFSVPYPKDITLDQWDIHFDCKKDCKVKCYIFTDDGDYLTVTEHIIKKKNPASPKETISLTYKDFAPNDGKLSLRNFYTYAENFSAPIVFNSTTKRRFYEFTDPNQWGLAYLLPLITEGALAKSNFFIQSLEVSIVLTFEDLPVGTI